MLYKLGEEKSVLWSSVLFLLYDFEEELSALSQSESVWSTTLENCNQLAVILIICFLDTFEGVVSCEEIGIPFVLHTLGGVISCVIIRIHLFFLHRWGGVIRGIVIRIVFDSNP